MCYKTLRCEDATFLTPCSRNRKRYTEHGQWSCDVMQRVEKREESPTSNGFCVLEYWIFLFLFEYFPLHAIALTRAGDEQYRCTHRLKAFLAHSSRRGTIGTRVSSTKAFNWSTYGSYLDIYSKWFVLLQVPLLVLLSWLPYQDMAS